MASNLNEFKRSKDSNRETSLKLPGTQCPRPFSALDTPLCPRFMPRPWAFFRNTYLLHDIGAASPVVPDFSTTTAASDACEFRSPTSSRGDNGVVGLTPWHSVRAPLRSHVPLAGRVMPAVFPPKLTLLASRLAEVYARGIPKITLAHQCDDMPLHFTQCIDFTQLINISRPHQFEKSTLILFGFLGRFPSA